MLRGGGLCVAPPSGDSSLPRVSPRIRALQDRLLDSLPADGAWECLSPAQREAIISLHRARITRNIKDRDLLPTSKNNSNSKPKFYKGLSRYGRSRSYEDKLESETDDSGVRLQSTSNTSHSHNSQEDDSSDPGIKKGRFTKSPSADRILKKDPKLIQDPIKRKGVTNGVGNVNKIISKQLTKASNHSSSKVTLDCRNLQEERSRPRIDRNNAFFEDLSKRKKHGVSRREILQQYAVNKVPKSSNTSSEDFEEFSRGTPDRYRRNVPLPRIDYDLDLESDQTARTPSPSALRYPKNYREERNRYSWTEGIIGASSSQSPQSLPVEVSRKTDYQGQGTKFNHNFDYRTKLNQDRMNKYSSNWNSIVLSNHVPTRPSRAHQNKYTKNRSKPNESCSGNSSGDSGYRGELSRPNSGDSWYREDSRVANLADSGFRGSTGELKYKNHAIKDDSFDCKNDDSGFNRIQDFCPTVSRQERVSSRKYARSKSLDRNFIDQSSDEESDFEYRRRTDRLLRYTKNIQESESGRPFDGKYPFDRKYNRPLGGRPLEDAIGRKATSDWNLSISQKNKDALNVKEFDDNCFISRSKIINKWKSQDGDFFLGDSADFSRRQWQRRSCDIDLDFFESDPSRKEPAFHKPKFDKNQWHRRSLDGQLDMDEGDGSLRRKNFYHQDWDDSIKKEMKIVQHREFYKNQKMHSSSGQPHQMKESRPKPQQHSQPPPRYGRDVVLDKTSEHPQAFRHRKQHQNPPSTFYPNATCPDHGWRSPHQNKPFLSHHPPVKKERGKGGVRGKLKFFRSILSF